MTERNNRIEEVKKIPKPQILSEKRICRVTNKKPEEDFIYNAFLLCETQRDADAKHYESIICQLFPQPLERVCPDCKGTGTYYWCTGQHDDGYMKCPKCKGTGKSPQPLDDKELRWKANDLLINCSTHFDNDQLEAALDVFDHLLALLQPKIEEARRQGIWDAIDNLKMHHCIVDVEARIKEIENG